MDAGALEAERSADVVRRAAEGDHEAFGELVHQYVALIWSVARRHGLDDADAADVVQTTWVRLLEHIKEVRDPARIAGWLSTTASREALRVLATRRRTVLHPDLIEFDLRDPLAPPVDERLLTEELNEEAQAAMAGLPDSWREVLELLVSDPPLSYEEIGQRLSVPVGSIGPTRMRSLRRLRAALA